MLSTLKRVKDTMLRARLPVGYYQGHILYDWKLGKMLIPHEPETVAFFKKNIQVGDVVADIGAHVGYYSCLFASLGAKVYAYEPDKRAFSNLVRAVRKYGQQVIPQRCAIGSYNHDGYLEGASNSGLNHVGNSGQRISILSLKDMRFDWAKIDVEGYELEVLKGMRPTKCTVEFSPSNLRAVGITPEELLSEIKNLGYEVYSITPKGDIVPLIGTPKVQGHCNLFLLPHSQNTETDF